MKVGGDFGEGECEGRVGAICFLFFPVAFFGQNSLSYFLKKGKSSVILKMNLIVPK